METLTIDIITGIANLVFILVLFFLGYVIGITYSALKELNIRIKEMQQEIENRLTKISQSWKQ